MANFKILLGKSDGGDHPELNTWRSIVDHNIEVHEDSQGTSYYLVGDFPSPYRAQEYEDQLKGLGIETMGFFPLIDGCALPFGWQGRIEIGEKKREIVPDKFST